MYGILFLFSLCLRFCWYVACWGPGFPLAYGTYHLFYGLYLYLFENLSLFFFFFLKFYGPDDQFLLLFNYGVVSFIGRLTCLFSPLAFYSLAHLSGSKNFL